MSDGLANLVTLTAKIVEIIGSVSKGLLASGEAGQARQARQRKTLNLMTGRPYHGVHFPLQGHRGDTCWVHRLITDILL
jgi:hypothetical protein